MLQEDNNQYQEVLATLTSTNKDLKRQVDQLRFDLSKASAPGDAAGGSGEAESLRREVERLRSEKEEVVEELEGVTEEVVSLRREKQVLVKRVEDVSQQIAQLQDQHRSGGTVCVCPFLCVCPSASLLAYLSM